MVVSDSNGLAPASLSHTSTLHPPLSKIKKKKVCAPKLSKTAMLSRRLEATCLRLWKTRPSSPRKSPPLRPFWHVILLTGVWKGRPPEVDDNAVVV